MNSRPIRWVVWLLVMAAIAVAIALAGRYGAGYVVFVVPPWRVELSVLFFVVLLVTLFALTYATIRLTVRAVNLRKTMRVAARERERQKARACLIAAQRALFSGRFNDAEKFAREAMAQVAAEMEVRDVAATLAAWAAHERGNLPAAIPYLEKVAAPGSKTMADASRAYMLLAEGRAAEALPLLRTLAADDTDNIGVMKMKVEAEVATGAWSDVLASLPALTRTGLMPAAAAQQIRINAEIELVKSRPATRDALLSGWSDLPKELRMDVQIASVVTRKLIALGLGDDAQRVLEETLDGRGIDRWDVELASLYGDCKTTSTTTQIERAERWLRDHSRDATLLATLGKLCMRQGLWGKAQSYLEASVALVPTLDAHLTLARLMEQLGREDEAMRHIRRGAELAR